MNMVEGRGCDHEIVLYTLISYMTETSGVRRCRKVCVCVCVFFVAGGGGGGGRANRHVIYIPSVKNQYKRVVFGYMVIY